MPLAAVSLEDHTLLPPDEVHADRRLAVVEHEQLVGLRIGDAKGPRDRKQKLLVLAPGGRPADVVLGQHQFDRLGAGAGRIAGELVVDGFQVEQLEDVRLVEGALQLAQRADLGQVQEGAGDGSDRDVVDDGYVGWAEGGRAVDFDAGVLADRATRHGDLDLRVAPVPQLMQRGRGAVREHRARATRQHGRHIQALTLEQLAGNEGVDGVVNAVQAAGGDSLVDGTVREPKLARLIEPEHPVLRAGELGHGCVERGLREKPAVFSGFSRTLGHDRDGADQRVTCLSRCVAIRPGSLALNG